MIDSVLWALLIVQVLMGAFDTIYHHEITERLAWRTSQETELWLHGIRNLIYVAIFLAIGLSAPSGIWAMGIMVLMLVELAITLWDFVEEDRTRELPATERVTHTLLTLNYGVILAMLLPILWQNSRLPTALPFIWHGWLSLFFAASALGVVLCGARDMAAARRARRFSNLPAADLADVLGQEHRRVLVAGGTGFVGRRLVETLVTAGHEVTVLTRRNVTKGLPQGAHVIQSLGSIRQTQHFDAIVNLAGESVAGGFWTTSRKKKLVESRTQIAGQLYTLCDRLETKPSVLIVASAIGYYGDCGDDIVDESRPLGQGFAGTICAATEAAAERFETLDIRVVRLRIGMVLAREGGLLGNLLFPFEWGLGGPIGNGQQYFSWIHRDDLVRMICHAIAKPKLSGAVNAVAPQPVRQREFAKLLAQALGRPAFMPMPAFVLRRLPGGMGEELFLFGQRVIPAKATALGFHFNYANLTDALYQIAGAKRSQGNSE